MPLTPKFFLSHQKSPFCSDHIGEKIIVIQFFLDFLWIFKIRKIHATVVHSRVKTRVGRVSLWHPAREAISLGEIMTEWTDCRSEVREGLLRGKKFYSALYVCCCELPEHGGSVKMYICTQHTFLWRLNNHFMKIQQVKWEPTQAAVSQKYVLMATVN